MTPVRVDELLGHLTTIAFVALSIAFFVQWRRMRSRPAMWMTLTFAVLAVVVLAGELPEDPSNPVLRLIDRLQISIVLFFPYFLFRFSASFRAPSQVALVMAAVLTGLLVVWSFFVPDTPENAPEPLSERLFTFALLIDWLVLSSVAAWRLWRQGRGLPAVAGRRMRVMSGAAALLNVAVVLAAGVEGSRIGVDIAVQLLAITAAGGFYLGYSPPDWIRASWRREALEAMRRAVSDLLTADTEEEVTTRLLPHVMEIVGARGVALFDENDHIVNHHGVTPTMVGQVAGHLRESTALSEPSDYVVMKFPFGALVVWTSPFAPFFGTEEFGILNYLGALARIAIERARAAAIRVQLAEAQLRRRQALEINDNVVQSLAVAKYAFELGDEAKGKASLDASLDAAKRIIGDLLEELEPDEELRAGMLVRGEAADQRPATS